MGIANPRNNRIGGVDTDMKKRDYAELAEDALNRADSWSAKNDANKDRYVDRFMHLATVYALLSIAQEISKVPPNIDIKLG